LLHAKLYLAERGRCFAQARDTFLEPRECLREIELVRFQLSDDFLQPLQPLFECHCSGLGVTARVIASTSPSRTRNMNALFSVKSAVADRVRPEASRATLYPRSIVANGLSALSRPANAFIRCRPVSV